MTIYLIDEEGDRIITRFNSDTQLNINDNICVGQTEYKVIDRCWGINPPMSVDLILNIYLKKIYSDDEQIITG